MNKPVADFAKSMHDTEYDTPYQIQPISGESLFDPFDRKPQLLDGKWNICIDQYDTGFRKEWYHLKGVDAAGNPIPVDIDFDKWEEADIPSCFNFSDPAFFYYEGTVWYTRTFARPHNDGDRHFLLFEGASYETRIWLNEKYIGRHLGGSTPFCVEVTDCLRDENRLLVSVNNARTKDRLPALNTDWFNYGGLYRSVGLYSMPSTFISSCFIRLVPNGKYNEIAVEVSVNGEAQACSIRIPELGTDLTLPVVNGKAAATVEAKPILWSTDNPKLYKVMISCEADSISEEVGFRQITAEGKSVYLNGKKIFLRGISYHEDSPHAGKTLREEQIDQIFSLCRELNCNFIRLAHYPHSRYTAKLADRLGFILWEEIPVYWAIQFLNPETVHDAENQLRELIYRDRNRASCCFWSVGNENPDTDERLEFMSHLVDVCHETDNTRLVAAACLVNYQNFAVEDRLVDKIDVVGINEYFGWYRGIMQQLSQELDAFTAEKPLIISELGAGALAGFHDEQHCLFSEEYQEDFYEKQLQVILSKTGIVCGLTPWILFDFRSPRRWNAYQKGYNRKGLVSEDLAQKKLAFYVLAKKYKELANRE